ncbi:MULTISPECIES: class II fructose-bisphosphate aldolase [Caldilinea]|jgi:fructose/tagatose bisphosphate aldolase|uniref:class II fructose-bisphosphate aldolase n=1 Tax=Caldilinea TaxID=233191 RepID=UPI000310F2A4|nr:MULTISPECIES: class II fructose-bisphosphate aldolase [Caldilinea]MBO9394585.1 class II fructose-bisphosphate aldolase [Caldilinea sp.]GIV72570.1 MAG: aldolase [Caldilinea sp.]
MIYESVYELRQDLKDSVIVKGDRVEVVDLDKLQARGIDLLARSATFGTEPVKAYARWMIWEIGQALGARPASIHEFYMARARNAWCDRTVPAMNIRFTAYDTTRAALRAAKKTNAGAIIFEIARSEMSYCDLPPAEYSAMVIAAAIKEGYFHPLFIQGDHFQVKAAKYKTDPEGALQEVKDLIKEAIPAGFWNIDIDTSTLVTLEPPTLDEQQRHNYTRSAELTKFVRDLEPKGVTISLGGEIGEVGEKNSTPEELDAYMEGYKKTLAQLGDYVGLSKVSVQTGTSHGGIVLPDGTIAKVAVDFDTLAVLGERARYHGAGGAVQHGASTLPEDYFNKFPEVQTLEIHLATGFMNLFLDHPAFPARLTEQIHKFLDVASADERKPNMTDAQFYYKTRKKAMGPFKPELWALPPEAKEAIYQALEDQFAFFYRKLNVVDTRELIDRFVTVVEYHQPKPASTRAAGDDLGLAD